MSKKDYILIARVLSSQAELRLDHSARCVLDGTMVKMAKSLAEDNPHFDRDAFLAASGHPSYQPAYLRAQEAV